MSVLISHPSVAPFVQQAARALLEARQLESFVTTVRDNPESIVQKVATRIARIAGRDGDALFRRRAVTEVPLGKVLTYPIGEILRLAVGSVDPDGRPTDFVWERSEMAFDRAVSRHLSHGLTGVYGYEHCSRATFRRARELGLKIAYDMPSIEPIFLNRILDAELDRFPELRTAFQRHTARIEGRRVGRRHDEWGMADVVIAASEFTKRSFAASGFDVGKVRVVHYGSPQVLPRDQALGGRISPDGPLKLLWAGTFGIRKGAHYLLEAWRKESLGRHATLKVFGAVNLPERVLRPLPEGIELCGSVSRAELMAFYKASDALIFPTLGDGFGMVATEAWACGLPVITTDCAGAFDLLKVGQNGLAIPAGDAGGIASTIDWCVANRSAVRDMREGAFDTAESWQWGDYRGALTDALRRQGLFGAEF